MEKELIPIGKIVKRQGNKGHVRLFPFITDLALNDFSGEISTIDSSGAFLKRKIVSIRSHGKFWIILFEGISSINEAQLIVGQKVVVSKTFFQKLPPGNYYWFEIIGINVYDKKNIFLGKIENFFSTGSNDVYIVKKEHGKELFVPAIKEVIRQINLKDNKMIIHLADGL